MAASEHPLTGLPDTDRLILFDLDDESLLDACTVSHYTRKLCDQDFWRQRFIQQFGYPIEEDRFVDYRKTYKKYIPLSETNRIAYAIKKHHISVAKFLIDQWIEESDLPYRHFDWWAQEAAQHSNYPIFKYLDDFYPIKFKGSLVVRAEWEYRKYLVAASFNGNLAIIKLIIKHFPDILKDHFLVSNPLSQAISGKKINVVKYFVELGQKPDREDFIEALKKFNKDVISYLLPLFDWSDFRERDFEDIIQIPNAAKKISYIFKQGFDLNKLSNGHIIAAAIHYGDPEILYSLLTSGEKVNLEPGEYNYLDGAVDRGNTEVVEMLLDFGASVDNYNAINRIIMSENSDMLKIFQDHGLDLSKYLDKLIDEPIWFSGYYHESTKVLEFLLEVTGDTPKNAQKILNLLLEKSDEDMIYAPVLKTLREHGAKMPK